MIPYSDLLNQSGLRFRPQIPAKQDVLEQGAIGFQQGMDVLFLKEGRALCLVRMNGKHALVIRRDGTTEWKRNVSRELTGGGLMKLTKKGIVSTTEPKIEITYAHVAQDEHFERLFLDDLAVMGSHVDGISSRTKVMALIALFAGAIATCYLANSSAEDSSVEVPTELLE